MTHSEYAVRRNGRIERTGPLRAPSTPAPQPGRVPEGEPTAVDKIARIFNMGEYGRQLAEELVEQAIEEHYAAEEQYDAVLNECSADPFGAPGPECVCPEYPSLERPNHFAHDSLGDPDTCEGDHNHPCRCEGDANDLGAQLHEPDCSYDDPEAAI